MNLKKLHPSHLLDRIKAWSEASDDDKAVLDRRAFLKGMAVTSAGLLVPGATIFDMGRGLARDDGFQNVAFQGWFLEDQMFEAKLSLNGGPWKVLDPSEVIHHDGRVEIPASVLNRMAYAR